MVETETGLKVKCLRSDNGGEYIDGGFSEYCAAQGIRMEKTIPRTPQENGLCTRTSHQSVDVIEIDQKKSEFVNLDELTESTIQKWGEEDKENVNSQVDLSTPVTEVRRSSRNIRPLQRCSPVLNYLLLTDGGEPECYDEALQDENSSKWELAMKDEMDSLLGNQTWELIELPRKEGFAQQVGILRIKNEHDGSKRYKARLVTFLHGDLEEDLYMIQQEGFTSLYGLKQAPRQWYKKFDNFMHRIGFKRCEADHCCYVKSFDNSYIILLLYVDDMLIVGSDIEKINNLKKQLSKQFAMKDLGAAKQILGMRIIRDKANGTLKLSQSEYVKKVLSRFNMNEAKPVSTPLGSHFKLSKEQSPKTEEERDHMSKVPYASAIGSLMYAMVCTRPDIAHAVGVVSRFMSRPGKQHWEAVNRKSTPGFVFTLGGTTISWASNLQKIVTLSTTEAEYVAATEVGKEMIWLHGFLDELGKKQEMGILHSDSQSAIFLAKNSAFHSKSKHIQTKYHFIRYLVEDKLVILEKICGSKNSADMLTKGVTIEKLKLCSFNWSSSLRTGG
ncbi:hypothetical protein AAG906_017135 [Vitis piasezkii]